MAIPLFNYIKSLLPHLRKDDILEDLRVTKGEFENLRQTYELLTQESAGFKWRSVAVQNLATIFYRNYKSSVGKSNELAVDIAKTIPNIVQNLEIVEKELEQILGTDVLNEGLTAKKAVLIRACEHFSFLSRYTLDVLNYCLCAESAPPDYPLDRMMSKASVDWIEQNILVYAQLLTLYSRPTAKFEQDLAKIPDVVLNDSNVAAVAGVFDKAALDPYSNVMVREFIGSPVYHFRLIFAEWQANRYKASKDKKQMLELRLLQLKSIHEDAQDPALEKQIQYLQDRIDKLDRKLSDMER